LGGPQPGRSGTGTAVSITDDTGYFWFFVDSNAELTIKVLDATHVSHHYWVFYGALSNVKYTITVRDTQTDAVRSTSTTVPRPASRTPRRSNHQYAVPAGFRARRNLPVTPASLTNGCSSAT
jgi:hypothetical protein